MAMQTIHITDWNDARIAGYRNLKDRELADEGDCFLAEGELIVGRLLRSGLRVESVLVNQARWELLQPSVQAYETDHRDATQHDQHDAGVKVYLASDELLARIIGYKFHLGSLAIGVRPPAQGSTTLVPSWSSSPQGRCTLVVAPDIINHDNLGSLLRISAGLGADGLLLGQRCCDPYWRRSIRVSMGAIFTLPVGRSVDIISDLQKLRDEHRFTLLATVLDTQAQPLHTIHRPLHSDRPDRVAMLVGNEAQGLPGSIVRICDRKVTIPMHQGTDSLNVAVATAIGLYQLVRR